MKPSRRIQGLLYSLAGLAMVAVPFVVAEYAFANWGDNGAAMLFVSPVGGSLLMLSFWGGLLVTLLGVALFASTWFKQRK